MMIRGGGGGGGGRIYVPDVAFFCLNSDIYFYCTKARRIQMWELLIENDQVQMNNDVCWYFLQV